MPVPFGVSVGDSIACVALVHTVILAWEDSHGAGSRFRGVVASLKGLESALGQVNEIRVAYPAQLGELFAASTRCQKTIEAFLDKTAKYHASLKSGGSGNVLKDSLRKVQWALYSKEDVAHFRGEINEHIQTIQLLLQTLQQ